MTEKFCVDCSYCCTAGEHGEMDSDWWECAAISDPVTGGYAICRKIRSIGIDCPEYQDEVERRKMYE